MKISRRPQMLRAGALALAVAATSARATNRSYVGPDNGNWNVAGSWSPAVVPIGNAGDNVTLGAQSAGPADLHVTLNTNVSPTTFFNSVTLNSSGLGGFMIFTEATNGNLMATTENIGTTTAENTFNQTGGYNEVGILNLGVNIGVSANSYNLSGANTTLQLDLVYPGSSDLRIGVAGSGTFSQTGGNLYGLYSNLTMGINSSASGAFNESGGFAQFSEVNLGVAGTASINLSGGVFSCDQINVGSTAGTATFNLSGGVINPAYNATSYIYLNANGVFNLLNGGLLSNSTLVVGAGGLVNFQGGSLDTTAAIDLVGGEARLNGHNTTVHGLTGTSGTVDNRGAAAAVLTINDTTAEAYSGIFSDGSTGTLGVTLDTTLSISGANSYTGPTLIFGGYLRAIANNTFSSGSAVTLASGGVLDANGFNETVSAITGTSGVVNVNTGTLTAGGNGATTTYSGTMIGSGTFIKAGTGTLALNGGGSFTGTLNVQSGILANVGVDGIAPGSNVTFGFGSGLDLYFNQSLGSIVSGDLNLILYEFNVTLSLGGNNTDSITGANFSGTGSLIKNGTGNLTIGYGLGDSFANVDPAVGITVNNGTVYLSKTPGTNAVAGALTIAGGSVVLTSANQIADTTVVAMSGTGVFNLNGNAETVGGLSGSAGTVAPNGGTLTVAPSVVGTFGGALIGNGSFVKSGAADFTLANVAGFSGTFIASSGRLILQGPIAASTYTATSGGTLRFSGTSVNLTSASVQANAGGTIEYLNTLVTGGFLDGPGTHVMLSNSTFSGTTAMNGATINQSGTATLINFTNGAILNNSNPLTWTNGTNAPSGIFNVNTSVLVSGFTNSGVINVGLGGVLNDTSGNLYLGGGSRTFIGTNANHGGNITLSGGNTLEVNGALLVNDGTISGTTNVNYGGTAEGVGNYGLVNVSFGGVYQPGFASSVLVANGATVTAISGTGTIDNTSTGAMALTLTGSSVSTFSGPIQNSNGNTSLIITGTSSLTLLTTPLANGSQSINTYSGGTSIASGGAFIIGASGALPAGKPVSNNGAFSVNANSTSGQLSGIGSLTIGNNAALTLAPGSGGSKQGALTLNTGSQFNLTNNALIIEAPDAGTKSTDISQLAMDVQSGRNGGAWNGAGITSSTVAGDAADLSIAVLDNALLGYTTFQGQPVDADSILAVPALLGDADVSGTVDLNDLNTVLNNLGTTTGAWNRGNFDGAAAIDLNDLNDVLNHLGVTLTPATNSVAVAQSLLAAAAPEPASLGLLGLALPAIFGRRKRITRQHKDKLDCESKTQR